MRESANQNAEERVQPESAANRHSRSPIMQLPRTLLAVTTPLPLDHRLASTICEMIDANVLRHGDQLPPEDTIAAHLSFSRGTVRQAISGLVKARILVKERGIGTFVGGVPANARTAPATTKASSEHPPNWVIWVA